MTYLLIPTDITIIVNTERSWCHIKLDARSGGIRQSFFGYNQNGVNYKPFR
jgi:hypothetical protein